MNNEIKKDLTSNWFKLLQEIICNDIEKIVDGFQYDVHKLDKELK